LSTDTAPNTRDIQWDARDTRALDGELVAIDEHELSSFQALHQDRVAEQPHPMTIPAA
jgi:ATP-dependent DNA ligase